MIAKKVGNVWYPTSNLHVRQGGIWKIVSNAYYRHNGIWKIFKQVSGVAFASGSLGALSNVGTSNGIRTVNANFFPDGSTTEVGGSLANWANPIVAGQGSGLVVKFTFSGFGTLNSNLIANTWYNMSGTSRNFSWSNAVTSSEATGTITIHWSYDNGTTTAATQTISISVGRVV